MKNIIQSKKNVLVSAVLVGLMLLRFPQDVQAQNALDLAITPPTAYIKVKPGSTANHTILIENLGSTPMTLTPEIKDFLPDGRTGIPVLGELNSFPYFDETSKQLPPLTLAPNAKARLTLNMTIPQDAANREYPLTVLFSTSRSGQMVNGESAAQVAGSIGSNLIILVSDNTSPPVSLAIKSLQTTKVSDSFFPIKFEPLVENQGYAAAVASGSAKLYNFLGEVVYEKEIEPVVVLGSSTRELFPKNDPITQAPFIYKPVFGLGWYKMEITLHKNIDDESKIVKSETIIVLPYFLLSGLLVVGAVIFVAKKVKAKQDIDTSMM